LVCSAGYIDKKISLF